MEPPSPTPVGTALLESVGRTRPLSELPNFSLSIVFSEHMKTLFDAGNPKTNEAHTPCFQVADSFIGPVYIAYTRLYVTVLIKGSLTQISLGGSEILECRSASMPPNHTLLSLVPLLSFCSIYHFLTIYLMIVFTVSPL